MSLPVSRLRGDKLFHIEQFPVKHFPDPWYVTGFCEAQATFTFSRSGRAPSLYFVIKRDAGDLPILRRIQDFFGGVGSIYDVKSLSLGKAGSAGSYFRVTKARELAAIVAHFDRFPMAGKKASSFHIWREMVLLKQQFRKPPIDQLEQLAVALAQTRTNGA